MDTVTDAPMPKVVGYVRGSTDEQLNTLEVQANQIADYCRYKRLDLVRVYTDKGVSGSTSFYERPAACEMLASMSELGATGIIITKLDRGFRNALDCLFTLENLKQREIGLHLLDLQLDPTSPTGELLVTMLAGIARFENRRRSERQRDAFQVVKAKGGLCGTVPYGWQLAGTTLVPDDEEQRVLRQIVRWIEIDRHGVTKIARLLNDAGAPTKKGGKKWFPATVGSVYEHRRVAEEQEQAA